MKKVVVIGSGMSAFGAAHRLRDERVDLVMYDKKDSAGGHTISLRYPQGFIFDIGPHVSFTKDARIQELFAANVDGQFETHDYRFNNYWEGFRLAHPAQTNLYGLPTDVIVRIIADFVEQMRTETEIRNYRDWLIASYGRAFAELFPERYTFKYHTTTADNLATDWIGPRMYRPRLDEVLRGALAPASPNIHYIQNFRYPSHGGFGSYLAKWAAELKPRMQHEVIAIDTAERVVSFSNGSSTTYDALVSSIPLPDLIRLVKGVPGDVLDAASRLACSSCVLVNLGLERDDFADTHISYFYDLDVIFPRVSYPHLMSGGNAPPGRGSMQVEVYFSEKYRPFTGKPADYIEPVIRDLTRTGVIDAHDRFLMKDAVFIPYANIIFDHDRVDALAAVHGFLDDVGIGYCGRYGAWAYYWTDDSFRSGEAAAEQALTRL